MTRSLTSRWRFMLSIILGLCVATITSASTSLTLQTAVAKTLQENPQLHQFKLTEQQLIAARDQSNLRPSYNLGLEVENFGGSGEFGGFERAEITVALSSVIELGNKRQSRTSLADARLNKFNWQQEAQTLDILGDLTSHFVHLLATHERIELANEAVVLSEELLKSVSSRANQGAASDAEMLRTEAMLIQSKIRRENLLQQFEREKVALALFWGETTPSFTTVTGDLYTFGNSQSFQALYDQAKASPSMAIWASEARLKNAEVALTKTQSRTDLSWQFGVKHHQESGDSALTMGISMPLFSGSRNRPGISAALSARNAVEYQQHDRLLQLHQQLYSAYSQREQFTKAHQQLQTQIIPHLEKALVITRKAYERGALRFQDWIAAQQELLEAKQQRIETAAAALLNQAVIEQLTAEPLTR